MPTVDELLGPETETVDSLLGPSLSPVESTLPPEASTDKTFMSQLAVKVPEVIAEWGIRFEQPLPGDTPADLRMREGINEELKKKVFNEAKRRITESPLKGVGRSAQQVGVGLAESVRTPEGIALLGLSAVQPELGLPAMAVRAAQATSAGAMSGILAKQTGTTAGTIAGGDVKSAGDWTREILNMGLASLGTAGAYSARARALRILDQKPPTVAETLAPMTTAAVEKASEPSKPSGTRTREDAEMKRVQALPEGPEGEAQLVAEDIAKAVEMVDVSDVAGVSPVPALVRLIRRAARDPAMKTAAEQAMQKIGAAAREQGVPLDTIKQEIAGELKAIYGADAAEMAKAFFGEEPKPTETSSDSTEIVGNVRGMSSDEISAAINQAVLEGGMIQGLRRGGEKEGHYVVVPPDKTIPGDEPMAMGPFESKRAAQEFLRSEVGAQGAKVIEVRRTRQPEAPKQPEPAKEAAKPPELMSPREVLTQPGEIEPMSALRQHYAEMMRAYRERKPINAEAADKYEPDILGSTQTLGQWLTERGYRREGDRYVHNPEADLTPAQMRQVAQEMLPKPKTDTPIPPGSGASLGPGVGPGAASVAEFELTTRLLPDMMPPAEAKQAFTQKFGAGNIPGIGKWFDPNAKPMTPAHASLQTYAAERYGVGPAYASRLGSLIKGLQDPFEVDTKTGDITNIGAREGQSRKISDVFEALQRDPNAYELNADQRAALERMAEIEMQFKELEERYQVNRRVDDEGIPFDDQAPGELAPAEPYFTRVVTARPKPKPATLKGQSVGAKQYFERPRMFDTEAEGWQRGYKYEPSIEKRIVTRAERLYKKIADKRLIEDSKSMSRTRSELDAQLRLEYADELASGEMTPQKLTQIGDSIEASGRVYQPGFQGRIFNYETAQALNKALERHTSVVRQALVKVNNAGKTLFLGFDFGNLFIQLLPTLYSNPAKWAQAATKSIQAFANDRAFASYVRDNAGAVRELAEHGSSTGRLPEFLAGFGEGEIVSKIPGAKAFGRQFTSALDVAKIELWKAYREIIPPEQWMDAIRGIESQLLSGRMESIGVSPNRALTERAFFLAPAYYRGALDLVGNLASRNPSGAIARRAIGAYMAVGPALYLGMGAALVARGDMTENELVERMNPGHRDFMMWRVRMGDKSVEVGFGGIYKSVVKLAANMVRTSVEHPENWLSLDPQENPITRWLRAHAAPGPAVVMDQITGRDFLGRDVDTTDIGPRVLPLALQAALRAVFPAEGDRPASPAEAVFSLLGLQAYTESVQREFESERNRMAESTHKKSYEDLSLQQQAQIVQKLQADERFKKPPGSSLQTERAIRAAKDRVTRIHDGLSGPSQELIEELGLQVRGYAPVIRVGRVDVPLTEAQREQYEAEITKQYDQILSRITPRLRTLGANQRQDYLDARLEEARERARRAMIRQPQPTP